jgi:hypothetical protein
MANLNIFNNIKYATGATAIAELITLPICTIKTNHQNTLSPSIINTAKMIYTRSGIKGFYQSSKIAISYQIFSTTSKYVLYRYIEDKTEGKSYHNKFASGAISGLTTTIVTHPMDMIKVYRQMNTPILPEITKNGLSIFYRGYTKTLNKVAVCSALYLPLYDNCLTYTNNITIASILSGVATAIIVQPLDYMKTRRIYNMSISHGLNILPYYKGLSLNLMRIVPHFVITMNVIEFFKNRI